MTQAMTSTLLADYVYGPHQIEVLVDDAPDANVLNLYMI
jgi:hypothetical protein